MVLGVKEEYQEKLKASLLDAGIRARIWYECEGDEEVVIVPPEMALGEGFLVEVEVEG